MKIEVNKKRVFDNVRRTSEYIGAKANAYDATRAIEEDAEQLEQWYREGLASISNILKTATIKTGVDSWELRHDNGNEVGCNAAAEGILTNSILTHWLLIAYPDSAKIYADKVAGLVTDLTNLAYERKL